jgi:hypothetical protein
MAFKGLSGGSLENADTFIRGILAAESFDRHALHGLHVSLTVSHPHSSGQQQCCMGADTD